jgi:hypothetical protein
MTTPPATAPHSSATPNKETAPPAKTGRGRKPGTVAKERADIPAEEMQLIQLPEKAKADLRRKRDERKPQQRAVDQVIWDIFQENVNTGFDNATIADWADLFVYDWAVTKTHAETALFMIKKATDLYHRKPIWGEQIEIAANKSHMIPDVNSEEADATVPCHLNGKEHVHIPFSVVRRPRRIARV